MASECYEGDFHNRKYVLKKYALQFGAECNAIKAMLEKHGVAVILDVLTESECYQVQRQALDTVETLTARFPTPFSREDPSTWKTYFDLCPTHGMLLKNWGIGHAQWMWDLRGHSKVQKVFQCIWDSDDLITSFDGFSLLVRPEDTNRGWFNEKRSTWLHVDQSFHKHGFMCVQGFVNTVTTHKGDGCFSMLEGSHKLHSSFWEEYRNADLSKDDWNKISEDQQKWYHSRGCNQVFVSAPAGAVVLWDSRLVHMGAQPLKSRPPSNHGVVDRLVAYVCMMPRKRKGDNDSTSQKLQKKRKKAVEDQRTTSHWPHKCQLNGKLPRLYGKPVPDVNPLPPPTLDESMLKVL